MTLLRSMPSPPLSSWSSLTRRSPSPTDRRSDRRITCRRSPPGDGNLGSTRVPANHSVRRVASSSMVRTPSEPTSSSICSTTSPVSLCRQPPTMRPSHQTVGSGVAGRVEQQLLVRPRVPGSLRTTPSWSDRGRQQRRPRLQSRPVLEIAGKHVADLPVEVDLERPADGPAPSARGDRRSEPPLDIGHRARSERAEPALDERRGCPRQPWDARSALRASNPSMTIGASTCPMLRRSTHARPRRPRTSWSAPGDRPTPARPTTSLRRRRSSLPAAGCRRGAPTTWPACHRLSAGRPASMP